MENAKNGVEGVPNPLLERGEQADERDAEKCGQELGEWPKEHHEGGNPLDNVELFNATKYFIFIVQESWKQIRIVEDDQKNVQIVLEDEECNIISENVSNYSEFSSEVQSQMLSDTFTSLPGKQ